MSNELNLGMPVHYRYNDSVHEEGLNIKVSRFYPIRETKCFYFVVEEWQNKSWITTKIEKRVSKDSLRRYCYPTKKEALHSYKMRKNSQIWHAEFAIAKAQAAILKLESTDKEFDNVSAGRPAYWDCLTFD